MLYQYAICTTVPQRIKHKDPHFSRANHDYRLLQKAPLYAGQTVSVINNDRTLWLPAIVVHAADHGSYIMKIISGAEHIQA